MKVVIWSIDTYRDVGQIFWHFYKKYWTNNEFSSIIVTEQHTYKQIPCEQIKVPGRTKNFGGRMRKFLVEHYQDDTPMFLMIDYVLREPLRTGLFDTAVRLLHRDDVAHVRLRPMPHPQMPWEVQGFGEIRKNSRYSLSLQPGLWSTEEFLRLMRNGESPWHTETRGSGRTKHVRGRMLSVDRDSAYSHHNYYAKGKVFPRTRQWVKDNW
jgi:hypothetical protein